jgi:hypothetical protein
VALEASRLWELAHSHQVVPKDLESRQELEDGLVGFLVGGVFVGCALRVI